MKSTHSVMLAAGGTAGHLFPAFALAEELRRRDVIVDLATDMRGNRYGRDFPARDVYKIPSATVRGKSPIALSKTAVALIHGFARAYKILGDVKPGAVVGFGGYPTMPPILAARARNIATAIHEQNAVLGRANKMLAKRATAIATTFSKTKFLDAASAVNVHVTGNPVRAAVKEVAGVPYPVLAEDAPVNIVIFGGSQGARYLSDTVPAALTALGPDVRHRLQIVQQAREEDVSRVDAAYKAAGIAADVAPFFADLPQAISQSHLVIARAGASTVAELAVIGRPAILVPLPGALDNDQLENARQLAESGAAWCIEQKDLSAERLADEIAALVAAPTRLVATAAAAQSVGHPDAASELADLVCDMIARHG